MNVIVTLDEATFDDSSFLFSNTFTKLLQTSILSPLEVPGLLGNGSEGKEKQRSSDGQKTLGEIVTRGEEVLGESRQIGNGVDVGEENTELTRRDWWRFRTHDSDRVEKEDSHSLLHDIELYRLSILLRVIQLRSELTFYRFSETSKITSSFEQLRRS